MSPESVITEEKKIEFQKHTYEKLVTDVAEFSYYLEHYNKTVGYVFTNTELNFIIQKFSTQIFGLLTGN